jgi:hypothetical protein
MSDSSSFAPGADPKAIGRQLLQQAHLRDGLAEIWMGAFFLLASGFIYARLALPRESTGFRVVALVSAFLLPLLAFSAKWVLKKVRTRYLIERWGFAEYKLINWKRIGLGILVAALMAVVLFGVDSWRLAGMGLVGGAFVAWTGRLLRFVIEGAAMATTGLVVAFSGVSPDVGFAIVFGVQGLITLASGCVVFLRFIRQPIERGA